MKGSRIYIISILALLALFLIVELNMPRKFTWNPTFSQYDDQPFGCAVFDDVLAASIPEGYKVTKKTFFQMNEDSLSNTAILAVEERLRLSDVDYESIEELLSRGNKVMLASLHLGAVAMKLNVSQRDGYFNTYSFKKVVKQQFIKDTLYWNADSIYPARRYAAHSHLHASYFAKYDSTGTRLAGKKQFGDMTVDHELKDIPADSLLLLPDWEFDRRAENTYNRTAQVLRYTMGTGELYLVSTPLLLTNYGMLDDETSGYIFRLLSQMRGMPLVRTEGYGITPVEDSRSPLRYFLGEPALRAAVYLSMALLVLFMIFTAKRRQRVIPVMRRAENKSLEFVELIGTLYHQKKDHADLVRKKYTYLADTLRRTLQVDLDDGGDDTEHARRIAAKTGMDAHEINQLLISLRRVLSTPDAYVNEELMRKYIDRMNKIVNQI